MRLLLATDHRFYGTPSGVYDTYCFDRRFFDDYKAVFDDIRVVARVRETSVPSSARQSDGDGVEFIRLSDASGLKWLATLNLLQIQTIRNAVDWADAVCVRVPSVIGEISARLAQRSGKPVMFELIGDPSEALRVREHGVAVSLFGKWSAYQLRSLVHFAAVGSYVSKAHLQQRYPPGPDTVHDSISSIRLPNSMLTPAKAYTTIKDPLSVVLVASFVPIKRHDVLIRGVYEAKKHGASIHLKLVGDGELRPTLESLVHELELSKSVTFYGHVANRDQLIKILDTADLFVMTSANEGMPRAMIEAMARGLPAIGSEAGGIAELLPPHQLFPVGDYCRLGKLLVKLQRNPELLSQLAKHSEQMARFFTQEVLSDRRKNLLSVLRRKALEAKQ